MSDVFFRGVDTAGLILRKIIKLSAKRRSSVLKFKENLQLTRTANEGSSCRSEESDKEGKRGIDKMIVQNFSRGLDQNRGRSKSKTKKSE